MRAASVFTYGTLLFPEVMAAVAGRAYVAEPATLRGFARVCVAGEVYPGAIEQADGTIAGAVYRDVDEQGVLRLDRFEGALYERRRVAVTLDADRSTLEAFVYVVTPGERHRLERRPWLPEQFRRDHLAAYLARCRAGDVAAEDDA